MTMTAAERSQVIGEYRLHEKDAGSCEVQVALLTKRINELNDVHLKVHRKDYASRRGLLMMVGRRSALLKYLSREDEQRYRQLIQRLGLRR